MLGAVTASHIDWPKRPKVYPLVEIPPEFPEMCHSGMDPTESVIVEYDINPQGRVVNHRILQSSNSCFDSAAINAVSRWKFLPQYSQSSHALKAFEFSKDSFIPKRSRPEDVVYSFNGNLEYTYEAMRDIYDSDVRCLHTLIRTVRDIGADRCPSGSYGQITNCTFNKRNVHISYCSGSFEVNCKGRVLNDTAVSRYCSVLSVE